MATGYSAQLKPSVVRLFEKGVNYCISVDSHELTIAPSWEYHEDDGIDPKITYVIDALDLMDSGTSKGYISTLNADTKQICYVLNTMPRRMVTTTFTHDEGSKVLLDEISLSSFGQ